jgi:hypothetical protein
MFRPGAASSNTAADHMRLLREAIEAAPPARRRKIMVTCDGADTSHELAREVDRPASLHGYQVTWSAGWATGADEQEAIGKIRLRSTGEGQHRTPVPSLPGSSDTSWTQFMKIWQRNAQLSFSMVSGSWMRPK